ncbi:MAG TPA: YhbY family RNA-binding protein [Oleiagrimonas sp.]|nr:YhbY family RNA-binding protein [Oleiagrimonas sp.]
MASPTRSRRPAAGPRKTQHAAGKPGRHDKPAPSGAQRDSRPASDPVAAPLPLAATQRRYLRGLCHNLKPLIMLGNKGITDNLKTELSLTLDHHELVKIRLSGGDREERQQQLDALLEASGAELVQQIGHVASVFRRNPENPKLALPR